ncbi:MAG: hypothetical protein ACE5G1_15835 [bacterium]
MRNYFLFVIVSLLSIACSSGSMIKEKSRTQTNPNIITSDEISSFASKSSLGNAYDLIYVLRPRFLSSRGQRTLEASKVAEPVTYLNGIKLGGSKELKQISVSNIVEVRFMNSSDAATFYGGRHPFGVIHIITN